MADTIIAKIQVRRGELEDLPALDEGEFGYALDRRRLFIGNSPLKFTADGVTSRYTIQWRSMVPAQVKVSENRPEVGKPVNYVEVGSQEYYVEDTDIVFITIPAVDKEFLVNYNTEFAAVNEKAIRDVTELSANRVNLNSAISWSLANYNSASIEYSLKNTATPSAMNIGILKIITNGTDTSVVDLGGGVGDSGISFDAKIENNRVYVTYTNTTNFTANLFYSIQLWNTI